jgi:plastocyanin
MTVAILALAALGGCGGGAGTPTGAPTAAPTGVAAITCSAPGSGSPATIADNTFSPNPATVGVAGKITWTNSDTVSHTVSFDSGPDCSTIAGGASQTILFSVAGIYPYHCNIHRSMTGSVTVN